MTRSLAFRGPDGCRVWSRGEIGLGHALLRTAEDFPEQQLPLSLDGEVWITADARIDARAELLEALDMKQGTPVARGLDDAALILEAYGAWGDACVEHLLGDFSFVIWDGRRRRLFGARDHFGVKPFYYSDKGRSVIFSNTINCLRLHPALSSALNERAIADVLLFDFNCDLATTAFADIQRLPPGHLFICDSDGVQARPYWTMELGETVHYPRAEDYVERFRALLRLAVGDRLRTRTVGAFMSGGLDSTSVVATANEVLRSSGAAFDLRAYTVVYDRLLRDEERGYSGIAAEALSVPIHYLAADGYGLFERWEELGKLAPEPEVEPLSALTSDQFRQVAGRSRVLLDGNGGDLGFVFSLKAHLLGLLRQGRLLQLARDGAQVAIGEPKSLAKGIWRKLTGRWRPVSDRMPYPDWLNVAFADRLGLRARWEQLSRDELLNGHARAWALGSLNGRFWGHLFGDYDPGVTGFPVEVRYPYFDLRVMKYLLTVPPVPWGLRKRLIREAMRGALPEVVRRRPKTPMAADPVRARLRNLEWIRAVKTAPALKDYVHPNWTACSVLTQDWDESYWLSLRPLALNFWLHCRG